MNNDDRRYEWKEIEHHIRFLEVPPEPDTGHRKQEKPRVMWFESVAPGQPIERIHVQQSFAEFPACRRGSLAEALPPFAPVQYHSGRWPVLPDARQHAGGAEQDDPAQGLDQAQTEK